MVCMSYTHNITSKGQITIPKEFRDRLNLDKLGKASIDMNSQGQIVLSRPQELSEVRKLLGKPTGKDAPSVTEEIIGKQLAKKYDVL